MAAARRRPCGWSRSTPTPCNVFGSPEGVARKYAILAEHCADVGRDPNEIEHSTLQNVTISPDGSGRTETPSRVVERFGDFSDAGAEHIIISMRQLPDLTVLDLMGRDVIPQLRGFRDPGRASPHTPWGYGVGDTMTST